VQGIEEAYSDRTRLGGRPKCVIMMSTSDIHRSGCTSLPLTSIMSFLKLVVNAMERIAPLKLAEKWDNVRQQ
jgi:hypothetical protein